MYDLPPLRAANDRLWREIATHLRSLGVRQVPQSLTRDPKTARDWLADDLLFSQTCGYPLTHALKDKIRLVATPRYWLKEDARSDYCSYILVRENDAAQSLEALRGRRAVINSADSQSGFSAFRHAVAPLAENGIFFSKVYISGAHLYSIQWLREGAADVCAVDAITYELAAKWQPQALAGIRIIGDTAWAPCLPYITRLHCTDDEVRHLQTALQAAIQSPALATVCQALLLCGVEIRPISDYERIDEIEDEAAARGYPHLR